MDARLVTVIERLSDDLANLEKALSHTQELLKELVKEVRRTGKEQTKRLDTIQATQRFMASGALRRDITSPPRMPREMDD